ncbi:MAG: lantibiotic dehydratase family protein [Flavobacterium nitrogenifigens]|uniref:lantibiotic dehydratase family protein n=1 Tax=Flavobacterium nitrogenifigens TaxID=1617283 RepID=UPI0028093784|nr:lantibiotic dehydratase family protein [Flavobacterium nitrogenifigens]MDQ8013193.1 lantibiotic dehydratase family protein [Flavobacterium nitrogenifigens]
MQNSRIDFTFFETFGIRVPTLPIEFYLNLTKKIIVADDDIKEILKGNLFKEAIFLASPELYNEILKWTLEDRYPPHKTNKLKITILKYLSRMSTRCTPFGLFSACGSGKFANITQIHLNTNSSLNLEKSSFHRKTRFDTQFAGNLGKDLENDPIIQNEMLFYPNSTIYKLGGFYRYVQYTLDNERKYSLEAVKSTDYLDLVIEMSYLGITKKNLSLYLVSDKIKETTALNFIEELITHQILVSELELTLTGDDYFDTLVNLSESLTNKSQKPHLKTERSQNFQSNDATENFTFKNIRKISNGLLEIDKAKNPFSYYEKITQNIRNINIPFDKKFLFQTDTFLNSNKFQLNKTYALEILKTADFLNKISEMPKKSFLENFKDKFSKRYEGETIPLVMALDFEAGIGYGQKNENFDVTPLLDALGINQKLNIDESINLNEVEKIIQYKLKSATLKNEKSFEITNSDFKTVDFSNESLPCTFSCVFEIVQENEKEWIVIQSIGGSSAANLLARFCHGNEDINNLAHEITKYETDYFKNKIVAEVVHLPEMRTGNILKRPNFRSYEIPYLGKSSLNSSKQINIEDILLRMHSGNLVLWSKKYDREIVPRLTNAHNYSNKALPIYHFLCDMQFENYKSSIGLNLELLEKFHDYFPRITFSNCIVSKAKWIFTKENSPELFTKSNQNKSICCKDFFRSVADNLFSGNKCLPQYVSLAEGDNFLVINTENDTCIEMLISIIKNKSKFILEEFLFPSNTITSNNDYYANQFIIGLKTKSRNTTQTVKY